MTAEVVQEPTKVSSPKSSNAVSSVRDLLVHAVLQDRVLQRAYPGVMHFMIFWGMTIQLLGTGINLLQYPLFVPFTLPWPTGNAYLAFELVMDIGGIMILIGVAMAAFRRLVLKPDYLVNRWEDWYVLGLLTLVALVGFASEAIRLLSSQPTWASWSLFGTAIAMGLAQVGVVVAPDAPVHGWLFWGHTVLGLVFLASIPFTKFRHMITGPLNIVLRPKRELGELETIEDLETADTLGAGNIEEYQPVSLLSFDTCVQCGRCESVCPSTASGMPYSPRVLLQNLQYSLHRDLISSNGSTENALFNGSIDEEYPWLCTTCGACLHACPLFIDPVSSVIEMRRHLTLMTGEVPGPVGETLMQMERRGNPWGLPKEEHAPWAKELGVRVLQPGESTDLLMFIGCAYGYDSRSQTAARSLVELLNKAGVDFAILGAAEGCCGETARRLGHEYIFQVMVEENIEALNSVSFNRLLAPCAHCFNTLKNEYPHFGGEFEVVHHTELLAELIDSGQLQPAGTANGSVYAMHDSCYLGRYNQIYDEPRSAMKSIQDIQLTEMSLKEQNAFCCGGGGGHMWMEIDPNTRVNHRRLEQAREANADVVVAACPYCLIMFDDAIRSKGLGEEIQTQEIAEVIAGK